ncbi:ATP-binding cassette domain-containing protein [Ferruginibacter paludis]|uniref:peptidase domain-containing ABC transporter n=1 Tax=Ferruginibacter paludis TaxID=1310417 RepID=UPI0025B4FFB0|nr:ATP-binding cassette domain-containing protein [Ferruginibacter paludis]MDN3655345.1 ATP-binding cassette domain-containing protein [Ferruginibacter paludis]
MISNNTVLIGTSLKKFYQILRLDKVDISSIYAFAIMAGVVQLSLPLGIQTIISFVMAGSVSTSIVVLIIMVVFGTFLNGLLQVRQLEIIEKLKQKIFLRYGLEFSDRLPKLDNEKLDNYYLPELVNRFFDTVSLQKGLEKLLLDLPAAIIQILLGLMLLSFYHPVFIGFGIMLIFIIMLILYFTSPQGLALALQSSDYKYKVAAWLQETARVVKSFKYSKSDLHITKTDEFIGGHLAARTNYFKILLIQFWSLISFKIIVTAAMLIVGSILLVNQQINVGQFIAADIVIIAIIGSVEKVIISLDKVYDALVSIEKLGKVAEADTETGGELQLEHTQKGVAIQFMNTSFTYPDGKNILNNINFSIKAGQLVHVRGVSGSGKSTLLRLLTGAYKNFGGNILIDGQSISNYNLQSIRNATGILVNSQDIFTGSLLENITMGNPGVSINDVEDYIEKFGLIEFVQSSKQGMYVLLDPVGKRLSKQVRQKILLIRAMLGGHRLLLLEEPFEYLDKPTSAILLNWLKNQKNTTILIASDDENLTQECDSVLNL